MSFSLRRHYPDQVIWVEGRSFLSARNAGLPTYYLIKLSIDLTEQYVKKFQCSITSGIIDEQFMLVTGPH